MYRIYPYLILFVLSALLQIFLFDNLSISIYLNPLVYIAFIALLPMDTPPVAMLGAGLAMGITMDYAMGAAGVNTIATLFVAFARPALLGMFYGRDNMREGGTPSSERMGRAPFIYYLIALVVVHHAIFFSLESLSWLHIGHTLARIVVSSAVSVVVIWLLSRIVTAKLPVRI